MKISHDLRYNVAYISMQETTAQVVTLKISDELNVDVGPDGDPFMALNCLMQMNSSTKRIKENSS